MLIVLTFWLVYWATAVSAQQSANVKSPEIAAATDEMHHVLNHQYHDHGIASQIPPPRQISCGVRPY